MQIGTGSLLLSIDVESVGHRQRQTRLVDLQAMARRASVNKFCQCLRGDVVGTSNG